MVPEIRDGRAGYRRMGGLQDLVHGETGFLFEVGDTAGLAACIRGWWMRWRMGPRWAAARRGYGPSALQQLMALPGCASRRCTYGRGSR